MKKDGIFISNMANYYFGYNISNLKELGVILNIGFLIHKTDGGVYNE